MKNFIILFISFWISNASLGQIRDIVYSNPQDTQANYYIAFKPSGQANGLLLLLTSFGETPQVASNETDIQKYAADKRLITVFASLQFGTQTFFIDTMSQFIIAQLIRDLQEKYNMKKKPFYMGGFSLGGSGVVKYAQKACITPGMAKPRAIFAIDPPLDFERLYMSMEQAVRQSNNEISVQEAGYFMKRLQYEFEGTPHSNKASYQNLSPFAYSDTTLEKIKPLINCPIMLISEPDIIWQMEERNRSMYDMNTLDCSSLMNTLKIWGHKNANLVLTSNKGYRKLTGKRNPHSWSIADPEATVNWLIRQ